MLCNLHVSDMCGANACVGGDPVQFMAVKLRAEIHAVQVEDGDNKAKCRFLTSTSYAHRDSVENFLAFYFLASITGASESSSPR